MDQWALLWQSAAFSGCATTIKNLDQNFWSWPKFFRTQVFTGSPTPDFFWVTLPHIITTIQSILSILAFVLPLRDVSFEVNENDQNCDQNFSEAGSQNEDFSGEIGSLNQWCSMIPEPFRFFGVFYGVYFEYFFSREQTHFWPKILSLTKIIGW